MAKASQVTLNSRISVLYKSILNNLPICLYGEVLVVDIFIQNDRMEVTICRTILTWNQSIYGNICSRQNTLRKTIFDDEYNLRHLYSLWNHFVNKNYTLSGTISIWKIYLPRGENSSTLYNTCTHIYMEVFLYLFVWKCPCTYSYGSAPVPPFVWKCPCTPPFVWKFPCTPFVWKFLWTPFVWKCPCTYSYGSGPVPLFIWKCPCTPHLYGSSSAPHLYGSAPVLHLYGSAPVLPFVWKCSLVPSVEWKCPCIPICMEVPLYLHLYESAPMYFNCYRNHPWFHVVLISHC